LLDDGEGLSDEGTGSRRDGRAKWGFNQVLGAWLSPVVQGGALLAWRQEREQQGVRLER